MSNEASTKQFEHRTFCHIFDQRKQDALFVVSILQDVLQRLKFDDQQLRFAFLRSDNGACYHSATITTAIEEIFHTTGIFICRIDFSEPQSDKNVCDRRTAVIIGEVRRYIGEKHNVTNSMQFVAAAKSTSHLSIFASKVPTTENIILLNSTIKISTKTTWPSIRIIFNIQYEVSPPKQPTSQVC